MCCLTRYEISVSTLHIYTKIIWTGKTGLNDKIFDFQHFQLTISFNCLVTHIFLNHTDGQIVNAFLKWRWRRKQIITTFYYQNIHGKVLAFLNFLKQMRETLSQRRYICFISIQQIIDFCLENWMRHLFAINATILTLAHWSF